MVFGLSFEFPQISFMQFVITMMSGIIMVIGGGIYFGALKLFGKEMQPYMTARMQKYAIFQIYSIGNLLRFEFARAELGGGFRLHVSLLKRAGGFWKKADKAISKILSKITKQQMGVQDKIEVIENNASQLTIPRSTYKVEGVTTVLAYEVYPTLHNDLIEGIRVLKAQGYDNISQLEDDIVTMAVDPDSVMFKNYTYDNFVKLYHATEKKFSLRITVDDVIRFLDKNSNQNFSESLATKDTNAMKIKQRDNPARKYAFYAVLLWTAGLLAILAYKVVYS